MNSGMQASASSPEPWEAGGQAEAVSLVRSSFAFLEHLGAKVDAIGGSSDVVVVYVLEGLTFEVELDWRDRGAYVLVCRTMGGTRPPGYSMYDGTRVRRHLPDAMSAAGLDGDEAKQQLREAGRTSGQNAMATQLAVASELLKGCVTTLLSKASAIYPDDRA